MLFTLITIQNDYWRFTMNVTESYKDFIKQVKEEHKKSYERLSQCDLAINDALHYLELEKCDAVAMVKIAKMIKELRQERRQVKNGIELTQRIISSIGNPNFLDGGKKRYHYRTKIMDDVRNNVKETER